MEEAEDVLDPDEGITGEEDASAPTPRASRRYARRGAAVVEIDEGPQRETR